MIWAYLKLNITNYWYLKYDHEKLADIRKIISYLDKTLYVEIYQKYRPEQDVIPNLFLMSPENYPKSIQKITW